jgi:hypothetical protein
MSVVSNNTLFYEPTTALYKIFCRVFPFLVPVTRRTQPSSKGTRDYLWRRRERGWVNKILSE